MIAFIKGTAAYVDTEGVIIDNQGIGYQVKTPSSIVEKVSVGDQVQLYTHLYVREDMLALYGFLSKEELHTFQVLLGVNGIGPKVALSVLSTMTVSQLYYAVFSEDSKSISKTPGIGPKGAKRMIMELKDKLSMDEIAGDIPKDDTSEPIAGNSDNITDAMDAMVALGYSNGEAYRSVHGVKGASDMDADRLLKEALKIVLTMR